MSGLIEISKAIVNVMKSVRGMEKRSVVGSGRNSYSGTKDQDVKEVFNEEMSKEGLSMIPIDIEKECSIERWQQDYQGTPQMKQSVFTQVKVTFLLLHTSGESIELKGYGQGVDPQDKGAGKAMTYAMKNCLLYTFMTPVGKIEDSDSTHSESITTPSNKTMLIEGTDSYAKAVEYMSKKGATILQVENKHVLSKEVKAKLLSV